MDPFACPCTVEIVISEQWSWEVAWFLKEHYCPARNHTTLHDPVLLVTFYAVHITTWVIFYWMVTFWTSHFDEWYSICTVVVKRTKLSEQNISKISAQLSKEVFLTASYEVSQS